MLPLIQGNANSRPDRSFFSYWTRKYPERYENISIQRSGWKLIGKTSFDSEIEDFELYNLEEDPCELSNLSASETPKALELKSELDGILTELTQEKNLLNQPLIEIGNPAENTVYLNRNDASGERGIWAQEDMFGYWNVKIESGTYDIRFKFVKPVAPKGRLTLEIGNQSMSYKDLSTADIDILELKGVKLESGVSQLLPFYESGGKRYFPFWVELEKKMSN